MVLYERDLVDKSELVLLEVFPKRDSSSVLNTKTGFFKSLSCEYEEDLRGPQYIVVANELDTVFYEKYGRYLREEGYKRYLYERENKRGTKLFSSNLDLDRKGSFYSYYNREEIRTRAIESGIIPAPYSKSYLYDIFFLGGVDDNKWRGRLETMLSLVR